MRTRCALLAFSVAVLLPVLGWGQAGHKIDNDFVQQTFGKDFTIVPEVGGTVGDLDGDGVEDAVIAARCKNPLLDEAEHNYSVIDPYYTFFGYGDLVVSSGLGGVYPKGINIGRIRDITAPAYETSLVLQVQPIIDFDRLEYIVLIGPEIEQAAAPLPASPPEPAVKP